MNSLTADLGLEHIPRLARSIFRFSCRLFFRIRFSVHAFELSTLGEFDMAIAAQASKSKNDWSTPVTRGAYRNLPIGTRNREIRPGDLFKQADDTKADRSGDKPHPKQPQKTRQIPSW